MLLTLIALTSLSLPAAQDATQNDWGGLSELLGSPDTTTPSNAEDALERQRRISELVQVIGESERAMNGEQRVLYVEACETLGRHDLILAATVALESDLEEAPLWKARARALVSTGEVKRAALELQRARTNPDLEAELDGLHGILAFAFERSGDVSNAALHGRRHIELLLRETARPHAAIAALPTQALLTRDRIALSSGPLEADRFLVEVIRAIETDLRQGVTDPTELEALSLRHLRMSARAVLSEDRSQDLTPRMLWLDWLLAGALSSEEAFWLSALRVALGDTAQSLNTSNDPEPIRAWCKAAAGSSLVEAHPDLAPALQILESRALNRALHLVCIATARPGEAPPMVLLVPDPEHLTPKTQRSLRVIEGAHPGLEATTRAPRPSDPEVQFLPQWMLYDADGRLTQVLVGDGTRTQRALLTALTETRGLTQAGLPRTAE